MREIEFRGKLSHITANGRWVFGNLVITSNGNTHIFQKVESEEDGHHVHFNDAPSWVDLETVGQYTGLKDSNGVKIFEGDIVRIIRYAPSENYNRGFIAFDDGAYFIIRGGTLDSEYLYECEDEDIEVIGNIHDSPELLNGKEAGK
jgi:uncharacterized phage protein (TIGR01671 family)